MQHVVLRDLSVLWAMFHVIFLFVMLFRSRYNRRKTVVLAGVGMGILMMSNMVLGWVLGFDVLAKVFFFTCSVPSFVFFYSSRYGFRRNRYARYSISGNAASLLKNIRT